MNKKNLTLTLLFIGLIASSCFAQKQVFYKQVDSTKLYLKIIRPEKSDSISTFPAMVFFFGGGWIGGDKSQFESQANYLAKRGIVCFLADYRTRSKNNTTPFDCLKDAKSAIRFIRKNASKFNIDPSKIIASGGSAGGQLAAATALINGFNEKTDDLSISCVPDALVLFNPVIDNGPGGYGYERISDAYKAFSPLHNIKKEAPPTIIFLGTKDKYIPVATAEYYKTVMEKVGSRCDLKIYEGQGHGFFNYKKRKPENYIGTLRETDKFLQSLGYLKKKNDITIPLPE